MAAESFWGSIASQLGGDKVSVTSLITRPDTDPHAYEPRAQDGRAVASASYVIFNGVGYDPWAPKLVAASGRSDQTVLEVWKLVGVPEGGNPHRWYSPPDVQKVIDQISADFTRLDPADAAYFDQQRMAFQSTGLKRYDDLIAEIRQKYSGTPVGASESIFAPLADALGLRLLTPDAFLNAISEGAEPTAQDKATVDAQLRSHAIKIYVYNSQNSTPDVKAQVDLANKQGIPVTSVTETPPAKTSFQDWQAAQLANLLDTLGKIRAA
ncbi:MAG TPA: zinc ABC transporter substrate-binding protein [Acidimicrobiales bacterium]|nr:zinc ABC transporter substrate-binding protein [Acidimicrobiales bacterium]